MGQEHKEYTWNLIAKKLSGEASPEELRELEDLLRSNPELHYPMQTITDLWNPSSLYDQQMAEAAFSRHVERMQDLRIDFQTEAAVYDLYPAAHRPARKTILLAACISSFLVLSGIVWYNTRSATTKA